MFFDISIGSDFIKRLLFAGVNFFAAAFLAVFVNDFLSLALFEDGGHLVAQIFYPPSHGLKPFFQRPAAF